MKVPVPPLYNSASTLKQTGASMVEILVSLLILSVGTLGMAGLQVRAIRGSVSSAQRVQAVMLSNVMMEMLRADVSSAKALKYNMGGSDTSGAITDTVCSTEGFSAEDLPGKNKKYWIEALQKSMGTATTSSGTSSVSSTTTSQATSKPACGAVLCNASGECRVRVTWDDRPAGGLEKQSIEIKSKL